VLIVYNNNHSESVELYKKSAYKLEDRVSYLEDMVIHGQPPQILVTDPRRVTGVRGILLVDVSSVELIEA